MPGIIPVRRVLLRAPAAAAVAPGSNNFTLIAHTAKSSGSGNSVESDAIDTTGADFLVLAVADYAVSNSRSISDNISGVPTGNTWHALTDADDGTLRVTIYWCKPSSVGPGHTFLDTGTFAFPAIAVAAFSGAHATPFDVQAIGNATSATASAGSGITPTQSGELIIAAVGVGVGSIPSINSGFTISDARDYSDGLALGVGLAYLLQTTAAPVDPDWTLSGSSPWVAAIASFKGA